MCIRTWEAKMLIPKDPIMTWNCKDNPRRKTQILSGSAAFLTWSSMERAHGYINRLNNSNYLGSQKIYLGTPRILISIVSEMTVFPWFQSEVFFPPIYHEEEKPLILELKTRQQGGRQLLWLQLRPQLCCLHTLFLPPLHHLPLLKSHILGSPPLPSPSFTP